MQSEKNPDCTVLVTSCDAYRDVEKPFLALWRKYWPDCPFETVLLSETGAEDGFDRYVLADKGKTWSEMLAEALEQISTPYVLMLMNDYFLSGRVDTAKFLSRLEEARLYDAANLRLNPEPPGRTVWKNTDLMEMPKNVAYCVTCQSGIWNREYLLGLARRTKSAWEFERYGSFMTGGEPRPLLVTRTKEFPFLDVIHKGYWEDFGIELMEQNGLVCDFSVRPRPPFSVRIRERLKSFVFAVFPLTLIVRLQNVFNIGKK